MVTSSHMVFSVTRLEDKNFKRITACRTLVRLFMNNKKDVVDYGENVGLLELDDASWGNLVLFFELLLKVDMRNNPHHYVEID